MKKVSLLTLSLLIAFCCLAQQSGKSSIVFAEKSFNFGTIPEEAGKR